MDPTMVSTSLNRLILMRDILSILPGLSASSLPREGIPGLPDLTAIGVVDVSFEFFDAQMRSRPQCGKWDSRIVSSRPWVCLAIQTA
jgi:hypothetical protein